MEINRIENLIGVPQLRHATIEQAVGQRQTRMVLREARALDVETRTVSVAFASETPVDRGWYYEILQCNPESLVSERLTNGLPLLMDHDPCRQVGRATAWSAESGVLRADCRIARTPEGDSLLSMLADEIRDGISVGYVVHSYLDGGRAEDGRPIYRAVRWEPYELSSVAMPADITVGVGRAAEVLPAVPPVAAQSVAAAAVAGQRNETPSENSRLVAVREIIAHAEQFNERAIGEEIALRGGSIDEVGPAIIAARAARQAANPAPQPPIPGSARTIQPVYGSVRNFRGADARERAYRFGQWCVAALYGNVREFDQSRAVVAARQYCAAHGLAVRAQAEGQNELGGYLVPEEFGQDLIDLREQFGVFRRLAKFIPMQSETYSRPRRDGGLTAYPMGEGSSFTESEKTWSRVSVTAKKWGVQAKYSSEISEDATLMIGDDLAGEISYAFAVAEDDAGFNGDGTGTYHGITGIRTKLRNPAGASSLPTISHCAGLVVATGSGYASSYGAVTLADFHSVVGRLPVYAQAAGPRWVCSQFFWATVMQKLALAAGGVTSEMVADGMSRPVFLGYPVEISQKMPVSPAVSQVVCLFGALNLAAMFGERRGVTIKMNEFLSMGTDEIDIFGTERFGITVHDVGNVNSSAASQVPGPVVALITAAS